MALHFVQNPAEITLAEKFGNNKPRLCLFWQPIASWYPKIGVPYIHILHITGGIYFNLWNIYIVDNMEVVQ